jgi:hypothetical protein
LSVVHAPTAHAVAGFTGAFFDSEQGDRLGDGKTFTFGNVVYEGQSTGFVEFAVSSPTDNFDVTFAAAPGQQLVPGTYENVQRATMRTAGHPGLDVSGDLYGCDNMGGRFVVDDASYDAAGNVLTFSARFEAHCDNATTAALFGFVSYHSSAPYRSRTVSANTLAYTSTAGEPVSQSVTITNEGPATDDPAHLSITGTDASKFAITGTNCTGPLAAGASCSITVRFTPTSPNDTGAAQLWFSDELAPLGSPGEPVSAGSGRFVDLSGVVEGSIRGTVTDPHGSPLADVCVLFIDPNNDAEGPEATTGSNGTYTIPNLPAATYYLYFLYDCEGSSLTNYAPVIYNNAPTLLDVTPVTVVSGPVAGINAQLPVGGQISGHVVDGSGHGLTGVYATAIPVDDVPNVAITVTTDNNGDYTVPGLATGSYAVEFDDCVTPTSCQTQWYDGATDPSDAVFVDATAGASPTPDIDATFNTTTASPPSGGAGGSGGGVSVGAPGAGITTARIFGADAIATSIATSIAQFKTTASAQAVVLARSDKFTDALAGGPLAATVHGPLLITPGASISNQLDPRVKAEIQRVLPAGGTVYVVGGPLALSPTIDTTLIAAGYQVKRVFGTTEYATAVAIAHQMGNPTTVFEATGLNFADALSAVPAAIKDHGAILLTDGPVQSPDTATYLAAHPADIRYAIGGPKAAGGADPVAAAVFGADLYGTSAAVAARFFPGATTFAAATGARFPDALSGGVLEGTATAPGPMLLVQASGALPFAIAKYLQSVSSTVTTGVIFGGPAAVSDAVIAELTAAG